MRLQGRNFILRSLYVAPQHRRWGGGRLLVETLCSLLTGYADSVEVSYTVTRPEHDALSLFLEEQSFEREDRSDERIYAVTLEELKETPFFSADSQPLTAVAQPFSQFSQWNLTQAYKSAAVLDENYLPVPLTDPSVDADVSLAITDGKQIRSFVVFQPVNAHTLALAWAKSGHPQDLPQKCVCPCANKISPGDTAHDSVHQPHIQRIDLNADPQGKADILYVCPISGSSDSGRHTQT